MSALLAGGILMITGWPYADPLVAVGIGLSATSNVHVWTLTSRLRRDHLTSALP